MKKLFASLLLILFMLNGYAQSPGEKPYISTAGGRSYFALSANGKAATLYTGQGEYHGVIRAVTSLQADIKAVAGVAPVYDSVKSVTGGLAVLIGTIGKSALIDQLISQRKLNVDGITGKWEAHITQTIENPLPGVSRALVIAGSDKRGTIYGVYELSTQIGVSPWYWWADVPAKKHRSLYVKPGKYTDNGPAVKYRGIFINDEAPAFSGWAKEKFGGVNHRLYEKMFELILRLKGNYLWPAMWGNAFNDDDKLNPVLADDYGVVMGTSHHEPMDRAQQEWKRYGAGQWNYDTNGTVLRDFWKKGIESMGSKETIVTVGMRGDGDMPMTEGSNIALLEKIVADQRKIIADVTGKYASQTPQMWALYKEVQDYYDKGMRVPDDVTLLLCDDNWGNIRKLPKLGEPARRGGYGIYYHFDYVGDPRNYKWLNTNQISKTWEQMHLAYEYGARQVWIVNVGDLKPMEFPVSFFLDYAYSPDKWPAGKLDDYIKEWAAQQFGLAHADEIADILNSYTRYNARRKPEQLNEDTYSLTNYREFESVVNDYNNLQRKAKALYAKMPPQYRDAYFELVLHPVEACANLNRLYYYTAKNRLYARQGRGATNAMADTVKKLYIQDSLISHYYNTVLANGKWNHMMDQTHIGYTYWQQPPVNKIPVLATLRVPSPAQMAVSLEGDTAWWPQQQTKAILPGFYQHKGGHYIDVFNRGQESFTFTASSPAGYINITPKNGNITEGQRLWVTINWAKAPAGISHIPVIIRGNGQIITVEAVVNKTLPASFSGFYESNGYVSMEAGHYTKAVENNGIKWITIPGYGKTLLGVMPAPVTAKSQSPGSNSPHLEYEVNLSDTGKMTVEAYISPTLDFTGSRGLRYAISIDDEQPQIININADRSQAAWGRDVSDNIKRLISTHHLYTTGRHIVKYWMVDPGVVLQKLVLNAGGEKPSYLGPPESYFKASASFK